MEDDRLQEIGIPDDLINRACSASMEIHKLSGKHYSRKRGSPDAVYAFAGSWTVNDFFKNKSFGETNIHLKMFPSMTSIGNNETAKVNAAFADRFQIIIRTLKTEVEKDRKKGKQIVFAGHSTGGPMAIFATLYFLENTKKPENNQIPLENNQIPFRCLTFGSPLAGDKIFGHVIKRENWSRNFTHFVMKYDIVPRIMLAPVSHMEELQKVLNVLKNNKTTISQIESLQAQALFRNVMKNASSVASYAASILKGCPNMLLETISTFSKTSPYRPFGKYIFCTGNKKLVVVENSDAVLQMLFYSSQLDSEAEEVGIALKSLQDHMSYENELKASLEMKNVIYLNHLQNLPLSVGNSLDEDSTTDMALKDLGLSTRARLCLRAAGELEEQKKKNEIKIDGNEATIEKALSDIKEYKVKCEGRDMNFYDAFKRQNNSEDFKANVKRLELAGIWDEIIELLKRYELPDEFEVSKKWIKLGTDFRKHVEPLDIANYYRHLKNDDTGPYMAKGRPRRYRYTQRWFEHDSRTEFRSSSSSCFWAEVEELRNERSYENIKHKLDPLEKEIKDWYDKKELGDHDFHAGSTFADWWKTLPEQHRLTSCLAEIMNKCK